MMEKLINYKADQLPGGRYWEPSGEVREILASLKPHNDSSESVLGMNDWLTTAFPYSNQITVTCSTNYCRLVPILMAWDLGIGMRLNMATPAPPSESRSQTAKTKSKKRRAKKAAKKKMLIVPEG